MKRKDPRETEMDLAAGEVQGGEGGRRMSARWRRGRGKETERTDDE
jgi:hypothetical protein